MEEATMEQSEQRIERLERLVSDLDSRVALMEHPARDGKPATASRIEGIAARDAEARQALASVRPPVPRPRTAEAERRPAAAASRTAAPEPRPAAPDPAPAPTPMWSLPTVRVPSTLKEAEDLLGGRVLAWVGGLAVLLGLVFLFALGISSGLIGEAARTAIGAAGSAGLLALGVWLHERKARTDAALACIATGISGLFMSITVAAQVYSLVPQLFAVVLAIGVGAIGTALAVRWESRGIAALGILGALTAPVLGGVGGEGGTMALLFVALASAAGVLLWQRWNWLALAAFAVATPQWIAYVINGASTLEEIAVLTAFGALGVAVAVGHEVRIRAERLHALSAYLLALNAIVVAVTGWAALGWMDNAAAGKAWLVGVALVHLAVGLAGPRLTRISTDLGLLSLAIGAVVADVAFGLIADGPVLAVGWAATGVAFAALVRHAQRASVHDSNAETLAHMGLGGHLALSLVSAASVVDASDVLSGNEVLSMAGATSVAALAAACLVSARITGDERLGWRIALDIVGLACVALLTAMTLDGLPLVLTWAAEVVALATIGYRTRDLLSLGAAAVFLGLAAIHALVFEAPPVSLVTGLADPAAGLLALAGVAGAALLLAETLKKSSRPEECKTALGAAALTILYLGSVAVVTPFESSTGFDSALLSAHQQGQMVLSVFWALVGLGTTVVGLRRDWDVARLAGLAVLGLSVTKVFLLDLATLTSLYRVVSFIGLGLLLLVGAFIWQRLRPPALSDLRETPAGVRGG
jgi:uncharacterized membrane protein